MPVRNRKRRRSTGIAQAEQIVATETAALKTKEPPRGDSRDSRGGGSEKGPPSPKSLGASPLGVMLRDDASAGGAFVTAAAIAAPDRALAAQERLMLERREKSRRELRQLVSRCRKHSLAAVDVLVEIMEEAPMSQAPSRVAAAKAVIEFGHGKAPDQRPVDAVYTAEEIRLLAEAIILRRALAEGKVIDGGKLGS